jgi:hypothetical protein
MSATVASEVTCAGVSVGGLLAGEHAAKAAKKVKLKRRRMARHYNNPSGKVDLQRIRTLKRLC